MMLLRDLVTFDRPFVLYKKSVSGQIHIWQQNDDQLYTTDDYDQPGFYMAPFDTEAHPVIIFPESVSKHQTFLVRDFDTNKDNFTVLNDLQAEETDQQNHIVKVQQALELIEKKILKKIVISRQQKISFTDFNAFNAVLKLMQTYENSMVYLWHHPQVGTWMGATPELLLEYKHNVLKTMALAGTLPVTNETPVSWQPKEIVEQQIVTDDIVSKLKMYSDQIDISKPTTVYQGALAHIKTDIEAIIEPKKLTSVIKALHPTPAVCGLPVDTAKKYIKQIEQYDRAYYTGFLGIKSKLQTNFYVNLRSMSIHDNYLNLYIGGGIVRGSNPEKEWVETLIKSNILRSVLS